MEIKLFKKHPIIYSKVFLLTFILILITFFSIYNFFEIKVLFVVFLIIWQFFVVFLYVEFLNIEFNNIFIKDKKIILLKKISILKREKIEIPFENVKEIKVRKKGILEDFFYYGSIILETDNGQYTIKNISFPVESSRKFIEILKDK